MKTWKQLHALATKRGVMLRFGTRTVLLLEATAPLNELARCETWASRTANDKIQRLFVEAALPLVKR